MELFDSHAHLNDEAFNVDRNEMIEKIYKAGVTKFMCIGYDANSSAYAIEIAKTKPYIYAAVRNFTRRIR